MHRGVTHAQDFLTAFHLPKKIKRELGRLYPNVEIIRIEFSLKVMLIFNFAYLTR